MLVNKDVLSADQVVVSVIFSLVSGIVSGLVYFICVVLISTLFSVGMDFSQVSLSLIVSYLFISIIGIFVALIVKMLFLRVIGYRYQGQLMVSEIFSLLILLVFLFVLSLPLYFFLDAKFDISFPVLVLGFYLFFNFISSMYLSKGKDEFISVLVSLFISFFVFFGLSSFAASDAMFLFLGVFIFPIIFLGVTEILVSIIQLFRIFFYKIYGVWIGN